MFMSIILPLCFRTERNIIEAASNGASQSVKLVANIAVNLIAFVALLDFVNATLVWFGDRVGMDDPKLTFQVHNIENISINDSS
jgi:pyrimidine nucleoside transport protein